MSRTLAVQSVHREARLCTGAVQSCTAVTMDFDWNDLRLLLAIERAGSLSGAGKLVGVDHSTVSRRLAALEAALGDKLVARSPDGVLWTAPGNDALALAHAIDDAVHKFQRGRQTKGCAPAGRVRISTPSGMPSFLVRHLQPLRERFPALDIEVLGDNRQVDLARGEADLAVRMAKPSQPSMVSKRAGALGWGVYASKEYIELHGAPQKPGDFAGHALILYVASLGHVVGPKWLEEHSRGGRVVMRADSTQTALVALLGGVGVSVIPCFQAAGQPALMRVQDERVAQNDAYVVFHEDLRNVPAVRAVADELVAIFKREASFLRGDR